MKPVAVDVSVPQLLPTRLSWGREVYVPVSVAVYLANAQEARQKNEKISDCFTLLLT